MSVRILAGHVLDKLRELADESVHCVVTSPPYMGLRDYQLEPQVWGGEPGCEHSFSVETVIAETSVNVRWQHTTGGGGDGTMNRFAKAGEDADAARTFSKIERGFCRRCNAWRGSLGLETTLDLYLDHMVEICREIRRVLRKDGTFWLNLGDAYSAHPGQRKSTDKAGPKQRSNTASVGIGSRSDNGFKPKDLMLIPSRLAIRLQDDGWYVRSEIVWAKRAPMPESVQDRPTSAHEKVFLLTKSAKYFYDAEAVKEEASEWSKYPRYSKAERTGKPDFLQADRRSTRNLRNFWLLGPSPFSDWAETVRRVRVAWDAPVDGKKRTTSPDCPLHGDHPVQGTNARGDGRADDVPSHTERSDSRPVREQRVGFAPIVLPRARVIEQRNLDSPLPLCLPSAMPRNSESRRTVLSLETNQPCSVSAQTDSRIERTLKAPAPFGLVEHKSESKTFFDRGQQAACRNADNSSEPLECTCEWYIEETEKTSHFATFPPELPRRCIMAGTSERGVCPKCSAPWARIIDKRFKDHHDGLRNKISDAVWKDGWEGLPRGHNETETIGWRATCSCDAGAPVPATILDPFAGAGTTLMVADQLQRNAIGIELSPKYVTMMRRRIEQDAGMFADIAAD